MTLEESLRAAIAEAVAAGLAGPLEDLRAAVEASARLTARATAVAGDEELARLNQLSYLDASESARLMRIGRHQVYALVETNALHATKFGRRIIIARAEIDRFMGVGEYDVPSAPLPARRTSLAAQS